MAKNADKVDTAIDKAGDIVDKKTQGKYAQHVDKVQDAAKKAVDKTRSNPAPTALPAWRSYPSRSTCHCRRRRRGRAPPTCLATRSG